MDNKQKIQNRKMRRQRIRAKIKGTADLPRVSVFKSNRHIFVQIINDLTGETITSSLTKSKGKEVLKGNKTDKAKSVGSKIADKMKEKGLGKAVFDRGGFKFHGRVKAVADGLREGGIKI